MRGKGWKIQERTNAFIHLERGVCVRSIDFLVSRGMDDVDELR